MMTDNPGDARPNSAEAIAELLAMLDSDSLPERLTAIQALGDVGDLAALQKLRERLHRVNQELQALVIAVGKLKKRLGAQ